MRLVPIASRSLQVSPKVTPVVGALGTFRFMKSLRGSVIRGVVTVCALAIVAMVALVGAKAAFPDWTFSLNPFSEKTVDKTGPALLKSLTDLSEYHAASGYFETVVDLDDDASFLPTWIKGEQILYVGKGTVDSLVNFGVLDERRVTVSEDRTSVTITLPAPTVGKPVLDLEKSEVFSHDVGIVTKFTGSDIERKAQLKAIEQMTAAASGEGALIEKATENTTAMLRGLFGSLGFTDVTINFDGVKA